MWSRPLYRASLLGSTQDLLDRLDTGPWARVTSRICDHVALSFGNDDTFGTTLGHATQLLTKLNARTKAVPRALRERIINTHFLANALVSLEKVAGGHPPTDSQVHGLLKLRLVWRKLMGRSGLCASLAWSSAPSLRSSASSDRLARTRSLSGQ